MPAPLSLRKPQLKDTSFLCESFLMVEVESTEVLDGEASCVPSILAALLSLPFPLPCPHVLVLLPLVSHFLLHSSASPHPTHCDIQILESGVTSSDSGPVLISPLKMFQQQEVVAETVGDTFLLLQENRPVLKNQEQSPNSRLPLRIF